MQCMQCEFFLGNLVLVDLKRVDTVGVWGSNPHAPTIFLERNCKFGEFVTRLVDPK
jgi:hypothetical protein